MTPALRSLLKYGFAFLVLGFVLYHAGLERIAADLKQVRFPHLILSLLFATLAVWVSALRMAYFFRATGYAINTRFAVILFYVGAFYNFLLPGGIGGDAYKVMLIRKRMDMRVRQGIRIMVADRGSGLCALALIMFALLSTDDFRRFSPFMPAFFLLAGLVTLVAYLGISRRFLGLGPRLMLGSLPYAFASQAAWVASLISLWLSLGQGREAGAYVILYCAASITGTLPLSVGGLGIKEATYYYGANLLRSFSAATPDPGIAVSLSLCLFAIAFLAVLPGIFWLEKIRRMEHAANPNLT